MRENGSKPDKLKVAIVGAAPIGRDAIPWNDDSWEIWGMNGNHLFDDGLGLPLYRRWDRWMQIHPDLLMHYIQGPDHINWMKDQPAHKPIYMQGSNAEIPSSVEYPLKPIIEKYSLKGPSCGHCVLLTSTVAMAMALALYLGASDVGLYGVTGDEPYAWQKEGIMFWLGMLHGTPSLKVHLPADQPWLNIPIYGYEVNRSPTDVWIHAKELFEDLSRKRGPIEAEFGKDSEQYRAIQTQIDQISYFETLLRNPQARIHA